MIGSTLDFVAQELNTFLSRKYALEPSSSNVQISSITNANGTLALKDQNILLLKLVNISPAPMIKNYPNKGIDHLESSKTPLILNLQIVLAAHFEDAYLQEGLDRLGSILSFLQNKPFWDHQNTPGLPTSIQKLTFELEAVDNQQLNYIWNTIGSPYISSLVYHVKMLSLADQNIQSAIPNVTAIENSDES